MSRLASALQNSPDSIALDPQITWEMLIPNVSQITIETNVRCLSTAFMLQS